ncbi:MAG: hypothetical protein ABIP15_00065, partial [Devosia sp.]
MSAVDSFFGTTGTFNTPLMSADGSVIVLNTGSSPYTTTIWSNGTLTPIANVTSINALSANGSVFAGF